jgi:DNA-binding transcriptional LysR family regulator
LTTDTTAEEYSCAQFLLQVPIEVGARPGSGDGVVGAPSLELRHLRYFVAVAEEKHFGRAAERLRIAQPGLSQQIKVLERSLGTPLLVRDQRHVELTLAGETLLKHAYHLLALVDRAVESARLAARGTTGVLRVGTSAAGTNLVAQEVLEKFSARFPGIELILHPGLGPQNAEALSKGALDLAFVSLMPGTSDRPSYLRLRLVEVLIVLPEHHPLAENERIPRAALLNEPFITVPSAADPALIEQFLRMMFGERGHPNLLESPDAAEATRIQMVLRGKGISVAIKEDQIPGVVFRRVEDPAPFIEQGLAWVDGATEQVEAFLQVARELAVSDHEGSKQGGGIGKARLEEG